MKTKLDRVIRDLLKSSLAIVLISLLGSCGSVSTEPECADTDKACIRNLQNNHKTLKFEYWDNFLSKPLLERVTVADASVVELLGYNNRIYEDPFLAETVALKSQKELIELVKQAIDEMPGYLKEFSNKHVAGIVLARNIGATADTTNIYDANGRGVLAARIALDVDALTRTANEWATWKEGTPFSQESEWQVKMIIEEQKDNNVKNAVQYILIHEIAHVIAAIYEIYPTLRESKSPPIKGKHPWVNYSWLWNESEHYFSKYDEDFTQRKLVRYYFGKNIPSNQLGAIYKSLEKTNFVTLYGATSVYDDWAEAFTTWVHVKEMKKPFSLKIYQGEKFYYEYELCWGMERCNEKEEYIKGLISNLSSTFELRDHETKNKNITSPLKEDKVL